jgi:hypothetical protein
MGINTVLNERLNRYELGFGSGLSPNGSDVSLLGRNLDNELVELVRTRWLDQPTAAGVLGLVWATQNRESGKGRKRLAGPGSTPS